MHKRVLVESSESEEEKVQVPLKKSETPKIVKKESIKLINEIQFESELNKKQIPKKKNQSISKKFLNEEWNEHTE
jgi:hypothetical protein